MPPLRKITRIVPPQYVSKIIKKKKVSEYGKEGQKRPTPVATDPTRKFYTSLLQQKPNSKMAINWCIEHGLFPNQPESIHCSLSKLSIKN